MRKSATFRDHVLALSACFTFCRFAISAVADCGTDGVTGIAMDNAALNQLIAEIRGTTAMLAETEQKVAAFKTELAQHKLPEASAAPKPAIPALRLVSTCWLPAGG